MEGIKATVTTDVKTGHRRSDVSELELPIKTLTKSVLSFRSTLKVTLRRVRIHSYQRKDERLDLKIGSVEIPNSHKFLTFLDLHLRFRY